MKIRVALISLVLQFYCFGCRSSGPVFVHETHFGIKAYRETLTKEQLARAPLWKGGAHAVPLSSAQAEQKAIEYAKQTFQNRNGWEITNTRLVDLGRKRWIYVVTLTTRFVFQPSQGFDVNPDVDIIVLMDGFVVPVENIPYNILDVQ